jgi:hypothetical protein
MDIQLILLALITLIYIIGLVLFLRKMSLYRKEDNRKYKRILLFSILGGCVLIFLWASKIF